MTGIDSIFLERAGVDLFVNFGVVTEFGRSGHNTTPKQIYGMRAVPEYERHTSCSTGVGLSHVLYLRNSMFSNEVHSQQLTEDLIDSVTPEGCYFYSDFNGRCRIQDPLKHRQHEVYRLGYLE